MTSSNPDHAPHSAQAAGWPKLTERHPIGPFFLPAYSEFMPPPRLGRLPYGRLDADLFSEADAYGWQVTEIEEAYELRPGLEHVAQEIMGQLVRLGEGQAAHHMAGHGGQNLANNPYWPPDLAAHAGRLPHERYVVFLPLVLSRTQDDKGRVRWTFLGGSEQGPERAFWQSFYSAPGTERPAEEALAFIFRLLSGAYGETVKQASELHALGVRILPTRDTPALPAWCQPYLIGEQGTFENVNYLLTFRPFSQLPAAVKARYFAGALALWPFPGSLAFWGMPTYLRLQAELPLALQIPLMRLVARRNAPGGLRVPQSGWLYEPHPGVDPATVQPALIRDAYQRTHRWQRVQRHEDELALNPRLDKMSRVLFSTGLEAMGLYDKPMARNVQIWTKDFALLLDGPNATRARLTQAEAAIVAGGLFGYRFQFPAMRVGQHEVYWHRPLVAYLARKTQAVTVASEAPLGYLTAYPARPARGAQAAQEAETIDLAHPVELWPRVLQREPYWSALHGFSPDHDHYAHQTPLNIMALLDAWHWLDERPLPRPFARSLLRLAKHETLEDWLANLPRRALAAPTGRRVKEELEKRLAPPAGAAVDLTALTYPETASRAFEEAYWRDIATLAQGQYLNKDNADCVEDPATQSKLQHAQRDLEHLGDYLLSRHRHAIAQAGLEGRALCGELPFRWKTDFDFSAFGGWKLSQQGRASERDLLVVIPGKHRHQAVVLADHYDTAYMEDLYEKNRGGSGARLAAAGADDNYSATATLLQAAPIFLKLAQAGQLERDVWLLHLTGEEFPSDCMGARYFCQALVEKSLELKVSADQAVDLSKVQVVGVFVMDMIAHNRESAQDIFQISPGKGAPALGLARQAHLANLIWNAQTRVWNAGAERQGLGRAQRSQDGRTIPALAAHLALEGEVRTQDDSASFLFNTDGQIFSDMGVPVVLFMENYDISRTGYHDTHDTLENIDLDYGAALAAIAIETTARVAAERP